MKTIAVFYDAKKKNPLTGEAIIKEIICKTTSEVEYLKINKRYLEDDTISKAFSFCWWLDDEQADIIHRNHLKIKQ